MSQTENPESSRNREPERREHELLRLKEAIDQATEAIAILDAAGNPVYQNREYLRSIGYTNEELAAMDGPWAIFRDPESVRREWVSASSGRPYSTETEVRTKSGRLLPVLFRGSPVLDASGNLLGFLGMFVDLSGRTAAQEQIARHNSRLSAINQLFEKAISCGSTEELGRMCLALAEELTASKFGFVGELSERDRLDTVALSDPGWNACRIPKAAGAAMIQDMEIRGLWGRVIKDGRCLLVNEPKSHPDAVGVPEGHAPITAFLGVPLKHGGETFGMLALANKQGGYDPTDQKDVEALALAFTQALMRTRAETALRTSEQRYRELLAAVTSYTYSVEIQHGSPVATTHSAGCLAATGYAPQDYASDPNLWFSMVHPDDREMVRYHVGKVLAGETVPPLEHRILRKDRATRWVRDTIVCHRDAAGQLVRYDGLVEDTTERKQAEAALRQSEQRHRVLFESSRDAIMTLEPPSWRFTSGNPATLEMFAVKDEAEFTSLGPWDLSPERQPDGRPSAGKAREMIETAMREGSHFFEWTHKRLGGDDFPATVLLTRVELGGRAFLQATVRDITVQKRAEDELRLAVSALEWANTALEQSNRTAESATRAKSEFLANMSHEIRTPMTAILGYLDLLGNGCPGECKHGSRELPEHVAVIRRNGEHLLGLINGILDLSKVESGMMEIQRVRCSPFALLAEVVSLMRVRAAEKSLPLEAEAVGSLPETVLTDPLRLRQVLVNLVSNAIKFTDQGEVRVAARLVCDGGPQRLRFDVTDTGIGMNEEQVARLFQPFSQVDGSASRTFGGTGLGLAISKRLVEALGGAIEVRFTFGKGSTFSVTIDPGPLHGISLVQQTEATVGPASPAPAPAASGATELYARVLLAEDGPDNQRLISFLLTKAGAKVTAVENGQLALEAALAAREADQPFDVILMDMQMPVMDGYAATQQLREQGYTGPIIALTAHAMAEDRQKCLDAGCDDYVSKPIRQNTLLEVVAGYAEQTAQSALPESET